MDPSDLHHRVREVICYHNTKSISSHEFHHAREKNNNNNTTKKSYFYQQKLHRLNSVSSKPPQVAVPYDFLGAIKLGKKYLLGPYGKGRVHVETLRGKTIGLFFATLVCNYVPSDIIQVYNDFKKLHHHDSNFEMIFVLFPPWQKQDHARYDLFNARYYNEPLFNHVVSFLPFPIVRFADLDWRTHLLTLYGCLDSFAHHLTFIDTKDNTVQVLLPEPKDMEFYYDKALGYLLRFGPNFYPFTVDRALQLEAQYEQLAKKTSIIDILGSESRDYLIDRHFNKVPISRLRDKDVLLYAYSKNDDVRLIKQLGEIYNHCWSRSFEIVTIPFDCNGGSQDEKEFNESLAQTPWLSLPFGDDKIWNIKDMVTWHPCRGTNHDYPIFFIKPKGESLLDPYGCHVVKNYGIEAYPFTRRAAARSLLVSKQKEMPFELFVAEASQLGLDFNTLIQHKSDGSGTEEVSLSTIMENRPKAGILLYFASLGTRAKKYKESLISAYLKHKRSTSSFEVIFISLDKDIQSFNEHFSAMPWFAFPKPLKWKECRNLAERTVKFNFMRCNHFLAFGSNRLLLKAGLVTKSFENCDFPFICDDESTDHLMRCIISKYGWSKEADCSNSYARFGWLRDGEDDESVLVDDDDDAIDYPGYDETWDNEYLPESLLD